MPIGGNRLSDAISPDQNICFVIMPISDVDGYEKGHFSRVYEDIIVKTLDDVKFSAVRADKILESHDLYEDIFYRLRNSKLVICDISSLNSNVLIELGFRKAIDKPYVVIKDEKTQAPSDISQQRWFGYDSNLRYDEVVRFRSELLKVIRKALAEWHASSPSRSAEIDERIQAALHEAMDGGTC